MSESNEFTTFYFETGFESLVNVAEYLECMSGINTAIGSDFVNFYSKNPKDVAFAREVIEAFGLDHPHVKLSRKEHGEGGKVNKSNKPKHTPGPWVLQEGGRGLSHNIPSLVICKDGLAILSTVNRHIQNLIPLEESLANAHLIAAAPEMLKALKALFTASPHDMNDMIEAFRARQKHNPAVRANELNDKFADALLLAQAAITKATGGAE